MKKSISFIAIYFIISVLLPPIVQGLMPHAGNDILIPLNIFAYATLFVAAAFLFTQELKIVLKEMQKHPFKVAGCALLAVAVIFVGSALLLLLPSGGTISRNQVGVNQLLTSSIWSTFIVVVFGPVVEEIIFRHILIGQLAEKIPLPIAYVLSVLLFGLIHVKTFSLARLWEIKQYLVIGAVFSALYIRTQKRLAYPLAAHVLNNLCSTLLVFASAMQ